MFATIKCHSCFWLLLLLAPSLLDHAYAQQRIGDRCSTPQGPGVCQFIDQCPSVFIGRRSDDRPVTCGFQDDILTVCCTQPIQPPSELACKKYERLFFNPQYLTTLGHPIYDILEENKRNVSQNWAWEFPHTAAVGFNTKSSIIWGCGGTLISDRFVLTAAHCLSHPSWGVATWVRLGYVGPVKSIAEPQFYRIIERIKHPEYNSSRRYNDIALLKLLPEVTFTRFIRPACLDPRDNHEVGEIAKASGWGLTDFVDDDSRSANLLKAELPIVAHSNCASLYQGASGLPYGIDDQTQICAGANGKDTCQGDSGGPLVMRTKPLSLYRLIGITSFGQACGSIAPGVYTRISFYRSWIESIVWPERF